jgi:hypothetical protein
MTTFRAIWTDVPQLDVSGEDLHDVLARTEHEYEHLAGDPDDDVEYLTPELRWALGWNAPGVRRRLVLFRDGTVTGIHIDEVPAPALTADAEQRCRDADHPMASYSAEHDTSVCACGATWMPGYYRAEGVTS